MFGVGLNDGARGPWQPPAPEDLQRDFPQYEFRSIIGRGGMGAVYKAWQKSLDRFVAIKILPPVLDDGFSGFTERFKREAKAMAQLKHPGIVAVYEAGTTASGLLYFAMEFIEGTDLQRLVAERGRIEPGEALRITSAVCEALGYAHERGLIHRDIKPSNIMIERDGGVKVTDLGLAKSTVPGTAMLTVSNVTIGTPDFMAPETRKGVVNVDHRADIYAVGVMLYEMLTGEIPRGRFLPPSRAVAGLDKRLDAIVDKALQAEPDARYSTAIEMRTAIEPILTRTIAKGAATGSIIPVSRKRPPPLAIAAGAVVAIGAGAFFALRKPSESPAQRAVQTTSTALSPYPGPPIFQPATPSTATKDQPFVNSLGMKFVPVPITGGPTDGQRVLFSVWETRVRDYEVFLQQTKREWTKPLFLRDASHPAINVSWDDAQAFCVWLTEREHNAGQLGANERYRLPSDHEWSCAVGIGEREDPARIPAERGRGMADVFPWGTAWPPPPGAGNYSGEEVAGHQWTKEQGVLADYRDDFPQTAPVGSFAANDLGLFDLGGNAQEWCEDWLDGERQRRVLRGASFVSFSRAGLLSSGRAGGGAPTTRYHYYGFRCVVSGDAAKVGATPNAPTMGKSR
jgi:serine/threonine protein kinase